MKHAFPVLLAALTASTLPFAWHAVAQVSAPDSDIQQDAVPDVLRPQGAERAATLDEIADALQSVRTASGRFFQINPDSSRIDGNFALQRPGRIRFEYDDPSPILVVSDGSTVAIEDRDLETFDRVPIGQTPLNLLIGSESAFTDDVDVLDVVATPTNVQVTVQDASGEVDGILTMVMAPDTYQLTGWQITDPSGAITYVQLIDVETNNRLSPRLFRIEDPEDEDDE